MLSSICSINLLKIYLLSENYNPGAMRLQCLPCENKPTHQNDSQEPEVHNLYISPLNTSALYPII